MFSAKVKKQSWARIESDRVRLVLGRRAVLDRQQLGLAVARVAVEVGDASRAAILVAQPAGAGDVEEEIGAAAEALDLG